MRDLGIKIHTDTKAERLIVKDGRIVGVEAHKKDGTKYIFSSKAVLLATGGYGANKAMLIEPLKSALYYGPASATGDGHRMAQAVGAKLELMEFGKRYPNGVEAAPGVAKSIIQGNYRAWLQSGILVNNEGRRLINEKASNHDILTVLEKQKGGMLYLVMDQATWNGFRDGVHTLGITDEDLENGSPKTAAKLRSSLMAQPSLKPPQQPALTAARLRRPLPATTNSLSLAKMRTLAVLRHL